LCSTLASAPLTVAQDTPHVVSPSEVARRLAAHERTRDDTRALLERALDQPQVRCQAEAAGVDIEQARSAIAALSDSELHDLLRRAARARDIAAGGNDAGPLEVALALVVLALLVGYLYLLDNYWILP